MNARYIIRDEIVKKMKYIKWNLLMLDDNDLLNFLSILNDIAEKCKPIKTERINEKGELEEL